MSLPLKRGASDQLELKRTNSSLQLNKFDHLTEVEKERLETRIEEYNAQMSFNLVDEDKVRQQIRDKFSVAMMLACEENRRPMNNEQIATLSMELEATLYVFHNMKTDPKYKRKARDISFNLTDAKNLDFRAAILMGTVKPEDLCTMEAKDMASTSEKFKREEREINYVKQSVIVEEEDTQVLIKSHKGEIVLGMEQEQVQEEKAPSPKEEFDPFNPDSYGAEAPKKAGKMSNLVESWLPEALLRKLTERVEQHLGEEMAERINSNFKQTGLI